MQFRIFSHISIPIGVLPRACCARSHQLWAQTAHNRCECVFVSSGAAGLVGAVNGLNSMDSTLDVESSRGKEIQMYQHIAYEW
uniref:Uncharacterized protein n=1 Tax=Hyaloperonospora arabidopsidis (strain Emoy2) TaxID=559515 RepID=M4BK22_HYAAE